MLLPGCTGFRIALTSSRRRPMAMTSVGTAAGPLNDSGTVGGIITSARSFFGGIFFST